VSECGVSECGVSECGVSESGVSECDREAPKGEAMTQTKVEATQDKNMLIFNDDSGTIFHVKLRAVVMRMIMS